MVRMAHKTRIDHLHNNNNNSKYIILQLFEYLSILMFDSNLSRSSNLCFLKKCFESLFLFLCIECSEV